VSWAIGFDSNWDRDIGYSVPATCDHPGCGKEINRGLGYVCGGEPYGGEHGCGLYFCESHLYASEHAFVCDRCVDEKEPFEPTPDLATWVYHKLTDDSWEVWRQENQDWVKQMTPTPEPVK